MTDSSDDTLPPSEPPARELQVVSPTSPQPASLDDLIKAAGPIATAYFESQERMQQRALTFDERALENDSRDRRTILVVVTVLSIGIMVLAGLLIVRGHDQSARELIQLVVSLAAAGFGGYGLGRLHQGREADEE